MRCTPLTSDDKIYLRAGYLNDFVRAIPPSLRGELGRLAKIRALECIYREDQSQMHVYCGRSPLFGMRRRSDPAGRLTNNQFRLNHGLAAM